MEYIKYIIYIIIFVLALIKSKNDNYLLLCFIILMNILITIFNQKSRIDYLTSSVSIIIGFLVLGENYSTNNIHFDVSIPLLGIIVDVINVHQEIKVAENIFDNWLFPIKMTNEKFILYVIIYSFAYISLFFIDFQKYTVMFAFLISIYTIKIAIMVAGRFVKTEIVDDKIYWCFKERDVRIQRLNFDNLEDERDNPNNIYIGTVFNSPLIKEIYDIVMLSSVSFFFGATRESVVLTTTVLTALSILISKNKV
ncbi:MAG: hypothetical protein CMF41_04345 [Legionellales bacterium]|nr:hypothetical protein [Legionellales bacterium]